MAVTYQFEPYHGANFKVIDVNLTNNDPGAIYNSGNISSEIFGNLAEQLWGLSANQSNYGSLEEMMGDWNVLVSSDGNVYNGWNNALNSDGSVDLSNSGRNYDQWTSDPGQNTMALTLRIPLSQLEADGLPGYSPETDAVISLSPNQVDNAVTASAGDGLNYWVAPMHQYDVSVIPEPGTIALVVTGAAILGGRRLKNLGSKVMGMLRK